MCVAWSAQNAGSWDAWRQQTAAAGTAATKPATPPITDQQRILQQSAAEAGNNQTRIDRLTAQQSLLATSGRGIPSANPRNLEAPEAVPTVPRDSITGPRQSTLGPGSSTVNVAAQPTTPNESNSVRPTTTVQVANGVSTVSRPATAAHESARPTNSTTITVTNGRASTPRPANSALSRAATPARRMATMPALPAGNSLLSYARTLAPAARRSTR